MINNNFKPLLIKTFFFVSFLFAFEMVKAQAVQWAELAASKKDGYIDGIIGKNSKYVYSTLDDSKSSMGTAKSIKILAFDKNSLAKKFEVTLFGFGSTDKKMKEKKLLFRTIAVTENAVFVYYRENNYNKEVGYIEVYNSELNVVKGLQKVAEIIPEGKLYINYKRELLTNESYDGVFLTYHSSGDESGKQKFSYVDIHSDGSFKEIQYVKLPFETTQGAFLLIDYKLEKDTSLYFSGKIYSKESKHNDLMVGKIDEKGGHAYHQFNLRGYRLKDYYFYKEKEKIVVLAVVEGKNGENAVYGFFKGSLNSSTMEQAKFNISPINGLNLKTDCDYNFKIKKTVKENKNDIMMLTVTDFGSLYGSTTDYTGFLVLKIDADGAVVWQSLTPIAAHQKDVMWYFWVNVVKNKQEITFIYPQYNNRVLDGSNSLIKTCFNLSDETVKTTENKVEFTNDSVKSLFSFMQYNVVGFENDVYMIYENSKFNFIGKILY
jgi:hypothetical protein